MSKDSQQRRSSMSKNNSSRLTFNSSAEPIKNHLLTKEEEYKRLNAELEKKTATLVFEAEQVLKANERLLNEASQLENNVGVKTNDDKNEQRDGRPNQGHAVLLRKSFY